MPRALLLLVPALCAIAEGDRTVVSNDFNFQISCPDSIDWVVDALEADKPTKARFRTYFADSEPPADAVVELLVAGVHPSFEKVTLKKLVEHWKDGYESQIKDVRDRTETETTLGGEPAYEVDLKGETAEGTLHRTYTLARMGKVFYVLVVDRRNAAVGDKDLEAEVRNVRESFKFLRKEAPAADKGATPDAPGAKGGSGKKGAEKAPIDPKLLEEEKIVEPFWRFRCKKPKNFVREELTPAEKEIGVKLKFKAEHADGGRVLIYVYVETAQSARYTLEQLKENYLKAFKSDAPDTAKLLEEDNVYKGVPLSKSALMWYGVKVAKSLVKERWILADCKNDRQYQLRIYATSGGEGIYKKEIEEFLKSFVPFEKE